MNAQEKKQFKIDWVSLLLIPLLTKLISIAGESAKDILDDLFNKAKEEPAEKEQVPDCVPPKIWNPILGRCVDDL